MSFWVNFFFILILWVELWMYPSVHAHGGFSPFWPYNGGNSMILLVLLSQCSFIIFHFCSHLHIFFLFLYIIFILKTSKIIIWIQHTKIELQSHVIGLRNLSVVANFCSTDLKKTITTGLNFSIFSTYIYPDYFLE